MTVTKGASVVARALILALLVLTLCGGNALATDITVPLIPDLDQFGEQVGTVQIYTDGINPRTTFGLYDTGASVITFSADDQWAFGYFGSSQAIPIKVYGGAQGSGIGGDLVGDVSHPGTIIADGMHAVSFSTTNFLDFNINTANAVSVPSVQAFVGTPTGSAALPTITGTPIHNSGMAAKINMTAYSLDLGAMFPELFGGQQVLWPQPDLSFVAPGTQLQGGSGGVTVPVTIPLSALGPNTYTAPGDAPTASPNPTQLSVSLTKTTTGTGGSTSTAGSQRFLFDTGSQVTIISTAAATLLGLNVNSPDTTVTVQGAAGNDVTIPGFTLSTLEVPTTDGLLKFSDVPVYVLDLGISGLDGILGMNLFNTANELLYDPTNGTLSATFLEDPNRQLPDPGSDLLTSEAIDLFGMAFPAFSGPLVPAFGLGPVQVPEPSMWILAGMGAVALVLWRRRRRSQPAT